MTETIEVEFENGILEDVPVGTPKSVIRDIAIKRGLLEPDTQSKEELSTMDRILQSEYLDIGTGITGSLAGAGAGFMLGGPPGAVIGGIVGGMAGTSGGELAEDYFQGKDLDYYNAFKEGLISGGIDVATLGAGKFVGKPLINFVKSRRALGMSAQEAAAEFVKKAQPGVAPAGSQESLAASQAILSKEGATLTPFQATGKNRMAQRIADIGMFSQEIGKRNYEKVNQVVSDSFEEVINRVGIDEAKPQLVGEVVFDALSEGRDASFKLYDEGMSKIQAEIGTTPVSTLGFRQTVTRFKNKAAIAGKKSGVSGYDDATLAFLDGITSDLKAMSKSMTAKDLINYERKLMGQMSKFSDLKSGQFNAEAARDLAQLSSEIRKAVSRELGRINPQLAKEYSSIKAAYGEAIEGILPTNLNTFITKAKGGDYGRLGEIASISGSIDQLSRMMKALETSHAQMRKAGKEVPVESIQVIRDKMRSGFLRNVFPDIGSETFDIKRYANRAERFNRTKEAARLALVMGDKTPQVKQLLNLMSEASKEPTSNIGELFLRTKEFQAAGVVLQASGFDPVSLAGAGAILTAPMFLAKVAYNPKTVNKLITFQNKKFKSSDDMLAAAAVILNDAMQDMSEEDQAEIRNSIRDS